jgi:hypothetical protein
VDKNLVLGIFYTINETTKFLFRTTHTTTTYAKQYQFLIREKNLGHKKTLTLVKVFPFIVSTSLVVLGHPLPILNDVRFVYQNF